MNYIITENHLKKILLEQSDSKLTTSMKILNSFAKNIISKAQRKYTINLRFLIKFGTSIGGLVVPLDNYIRTNNLELNDEQIALILVGVAATYFSENIRKINEIYNKIREEGIYDIFTNVANKAEELKITFFEFLSSLKTTIDSTTEMISYSFLIPIITDILSISHEVLDPIQAASNITERLLASGVVVLAGMALNEILTKICSRMLNR